MYLRSCQREGKRINPIGAGKNIEETQKQSQEIKRERRNPAGEREKKNKNRENLITFFCLPFLSLQPHCWGADEIRNHMCPQSRVAHPSCHRWSFLPVGHNPSGSGLNAFKNIGSYVSRVKI